MVYEHLKLLGLKVVDKVTGYKGVVSSISFDLYGCIQVSLNPGLDENGKVQDQYWFDISRFTILDNTPVMKQPNFTNGKIAEGEHGPAEKPK